MALDWLELRETPWGARAFVLVGVLSHSGRLRCWFSESMDQAHLVAGIHQVLSRLGGTARRWRTDRMATVVAPGTDRDVRKTVRQPCECLQSEQQVSVRRRRPRDAQITPSVSGPQPGGLGERLQCRRAPGTPSSATPERPQRCGLPAPGLAHRDHHRPGGRGVLHGPAEAGAAGLGRRPRGAC